MHAAPSAADIAASTPLVGDELHYLAALVPITNRRVLDIGCGEGAFTRRLMTEAGARSAVGIETDPERRTTAMHGGPVPGLAFERGVAEDIPLPNASVDLALMLKSLHHVPLPSMDQAFAEVHRVLADGGWLYISEPVYAGEFNEVMRLFRDEGVVRAAAYEAIGRAGRSGRWGLMTEAIVDVPLRFRDFDDFFERMAVRAGMSVPDDVLPAVRERFGRSLGDDGARFLRPLRVNLLRKR